MDLERNTLEGTDRVIWTHPADRCALPRQCTIHNRSNHHMRHFPQNWRSDRAFMERVCPHGIGHPDPDQMAFLRSVLPMDEAHAEGIHGCDGCCYEEEQ